MIGVFQTCSMHHIVSMHICVNNRTCTLVKTSEKMKYRDEDYFDLKELTECSDLRRMSVTASLRALRAF